MDTICAECRRFGLALEQATQELSSRSALVLNRPGTDGYGVAAGTESQWQDVESARLEVESAYAAYRTHLVTAHPGQMGNWDLADT